MEERGSLIDRVGQEQIHGMLFVEKLSWQQLINDLIKSEQLDPWDIDISLLSNKFLEKVKLLEEANFFVSSQVLLAASLLLRLKSDILLDRYIPELDAVLYGKKPEEKKYAQERIELDEEVPGLVLRTPLPRFRKVTLEELMGALGHAIKTENRRIRKIILTKQQEMETSLSLPKHRINIKDSIRDVHSKLKRAFAHQDEEIAFSDLAGKSNHERISTFIPLLHLDNQHKVWIEQHKHLDEIWILLKELYEKKNSESLDTMSKEAETAIEALAKEEKELRAIKNGEDVASDDEDNGKSSNVMSDLGESKYSKKDSRNEDTDNTEEY